MFTRGIVSLAALLFAATSVMIWSDPERIGAAFGLTAASAAGVASIRADLGGLFAGLAALCGLAAWTRLPSWHKSAAVVLAAIVAGRMIGWMAGGGHAGDGLSLGIELVVLGALAMSARSNHRAAAVRTPSRTAAVAAWASMALIAGGIAALANPRVEQGIFDRAAERLAGSANTAPLADDALRVAICGSSAPLPSADRAKACVAVFAGGKFYVVDVGPESVENLVMWGIPLSSIGGVLLTHFHSDHIGDLGELNLQSWAAGRPAPLAVYGGPGVEAVVDGFNIAYRLDQGYRTAHHTAKAMPPETWPMRARPIALPGASTPAKDRTAVVLDEGGLRITAIEVDHAPIEPAYAYRFDYKGRSALITGDLKAHAPLSAAARGADLMVSEAISLSMTRALGNGARAAGRDQAAKIMHDIEDYHITPEQSAWLANEAGVKLLVFYHLLPAPDGWLPRRLFAQGIDEARQGAWTIANDGSLYTLPLGSREIRRGDM